MKCYFCASEPIKILSNGLAGQKPYSYDCIRCGHVNLENDTANLLRDRNFSEIECSIISIHIRNEYEKSHRKYFPIPLTMDDLNRIVQSTKALNPLEKLDAALLNIERESDYVGKRLKINPGNDSPYYNCINGKELYSILYLLCKEGLIAAPDPDNPHNDLYIVTKGYERLRDIKSRRRDLAFVLLPCGLLMR